MGLGSLFSSSSSSKAEELNTSQNAGFSEVSGVATGINLTGSKSGGTNQKIVVTDQGAVKQAIGLSESAIKYNTINTAKAIDFGDSAIDKALKFASGASRQSQEAVKQTVSDFTGKFSEFANRQSNSNDQRMTDLAKWAIGGTLAVLAFNAYNRGKKA